MAVADVWRKFSSPDKGNMDLIRRAAGNNFALKIVLIPGISNLSADVLSRFQSEKNIYNLVLQHLGLQLILICASCSLA